MYSMFISACDCHFELNMIKCMIILNEHLNDILLLAFELFSDMFVGVVHDLDDESIINKRMLLFSIHIYITRVDSTMMYDTPSTRITGWLMWSLVALCGFAFAGRETPDRPKRGCSIFFFPSRWTEKNVYGWNRLGHVAKLSYFVVYRNLETTHPTVGTTLRKHTNSPPIHKRPDTPYTAS